MKENTEHFKVLVNTAYLEHYFYSWKERKRERERVNQGTFT